MSFQSIPKMFDNIYVSTICITLLVLYISFLGPTLPPFIKTLFENTIFKIFVLFLFVVRGNQDPLFSLMLVIAFVFTLDMLNTEEAIEKYTNLNNPEKKK